MMRLWVTHRLIVLSLRMMRLLYPIPRNSVVFCSMMFRSVLFGSVLFRSFCSALVSTIEIASFG